MKSFVSIISCLTLIPTAVGDSLEAYHAKPFGIGRLTLSQPAKGARRTPLSTTRLADRLQRDRGSVMRYPVAERSGLVGEQEGEGTLHSIYFLFDPTDELSIELKASQVLTTTVKLDDPRARQFHDRWWKLYVAQASANSRDGRTPTELEQYLVGMLARRHGKATPTVAPPRDLRATSTDDMIAVLTGAESLQLAMQKDSLLETRGRNVVATLPLPQGVAPPAVEIPDVKGVVEIERLANVVPQECFYARFGSFEDFQWFRERMGQWGTDLRGLVSASSIDYGIAERLQQQLQIFDADLPALLDGNTLQDMAVIGTDTLLGQGAGLGFVLRAEDAAAFEDNLRTIRRDYADRNPRMTFESFRLAEYEQTISLLSTSDNSVRSYHVAAGDYQLVTSSRFILQRFLDVTTNGAGSLGGTKEFRFARSMYPLADDQAVFLHLSDPFFRHLVAPEFRIEMTRRARFQRECRQYHLAVMAAQSEGLPADTLADLKEAGFLPPSFGQYPDGSVMKIVDGRPINTVRGGAGTMAPVVDVKVKAATPREVEGYQTFSNRYRRIWARMDPASIGIKREESDGVEHITMDLHVFPVPAQEYGMLSMFLPPPNKERLTRPPASLLMLEADIRFAAEGRGFLGVLDQDIPFHVSDNKVEPLSSVEDEHPAFIGGNMAILTLFGNHIAKLKAGEYFRSSTVFPNAWGYRGEEFFVEAATKENTQLVIPHLQRQDAVRPAQLRLHVGDLSAARMKKFANALVWTRTKKIADANEFLPDRLASQLHVSPQTAWEKAAQVLGGTPICPFGGEYRFIQRAGGVSKDAWRSTEAPSWSEYRLPIFDSVRGAEVELSVDRTSLTTHAEIWLGP